MSRFTEAGLLVFIVLALAACGGSGGSGGSTPTPSAPVYTVTVSFDTALATRNMSGFLQAFNETSPPDAMIRPLRAAHLRSGYFRTNYDRARGFGMTVHAVLSDTWGYPSPENGWPFQNWPAFEAHVKTIAAAFVGRPIVWDIWNEPDAPSFWAGTRGQYFETFRRAYFALREVLGDALEVEGPSLSRYDAGFLTDFLTDAVANGVKVHWLTWHELGNDVRAVQSRLSSAKTGYIQNAVYGALGLKGILINEVTSEGNQYNPAHILGYLNMLEAGEADGANKSCWTNYAGEPFVNCNNWTLDGIVTPVTYQPRAAWWAYKAYGDGVDSRIKADSRDDAIHALASSRSDDANVAQVLLAYFTNDVNQPAKSVSVQLKSLGSIGALAGAGAVNLRIEKLLNRGEVVVDGFTLVREENRAISNGAVLLELSSCQNGEVYRILISRG